VDKEVGVAGLRTGRPLRPERRHANPSSATPQLGYAPGNVVQVPLIPKIVNIKSGQFHS